MAAATFAGLEIERAQILSLDRYKRVRLEISMVRSGWRPIINMMLFRSPRKSQRLLNLPAGHHSRGVADQEDLIFFKSGCGVRIPRGGRLGLLWSASCTGCAF